MMEILYFGGFELPDKNAAAHRALNNAKALRGKGYKVILCGVSKEPQASTLERENIQGFEAYHIQYPRTAGEWLKRLTNISYLQTILKEHPDVRLIIAYNAYSFMLSRLNCAAHAQGIKVIADCTEWYEDRFSLKPREFIQFINSNYLMKHVNRRLDGLFVTSTFLASYYKGMQILRLPPLVDTSEDIWTAEVDEPREEPTKIIYTGIPGPDKDKLKTIIHAIAVSSRRDLEFEVVGMTQEEYLEQNPKGLEDIKVLHKRISFSGRLPHDETIKKLRCSDVAIIIRDKTRKNQAGFPTKFVEAYTAGIQIIANDFSDVKDYASDRVRIIQTEALGTCVESGLRHLETKKIHLEFDYQQWEDRIDAFISQIMD